MQEELVFNIWFIVDIGTSLCNYAIVKPYNILGSDEEKIKILKILAETDYVTSERIEFAQNSKIVFSNQTITGYIHKDNINQYFDNNIDFFLNLIEEDLPKILKFKGGFWGENKAISQKFPKNPLFVLTFLMENEIGEIKPYTTTTNKEWYKSEVIRIDNLL